MSPSGDEVPVLGREADVMVDISEMSTNTVTGLAVSHSSTICPPS